MDILKRTRIAAFVTATLLTTACSQMTVEERLNKAEDALSEDNYKQAIVHLKAAVQQSPTDVRPRIELAKVYFDIGDMVSAITTFDKVLTQRGDINDFADEYFLSLYSMADLDIFEVTFEEFKGQLNNGQRISAELIAAVISGRSRSQEQAEDHLKVARELAKENATPAVKSKIDDYALIINGYLLSDNPGDVNVLSALSEKYPDDWMIRSLTAEILQASGQFKEAAENYEALLALKPFFAQLNLNIAEAYIKAKEFKKAQTYVEKVLSLSADQPLANQQMAIIALSEHDFESAARHIDISLNQNMVNMTSVYIAGISHFQIGNYEQALSYLEKVVDKFPPNHPGLQMYIAAKLSAGDTLDSYSLYKKYPSLVSSNTRLATKAASALIFSGERNKAAEILSNVKNDAFQNPVQQQQLGLLKLSVGDSDGEDLLETSSQQIVKDAAEGNSTQSKLFLVAMKATNGDEEEARSIINEWIEAEPDNAENYLISAQFESYTGNTDALEALYTKVRNLEPANIEAAKYFAEKAFRNGDAEEALKAYSRVLKEQPNDQIALTGAYVSAQALPDKKATFKTIDNILSQNSKTSAFSTLFAAFLKQDYKEVVSLSRSSIFGFGEQPKVDFLLSQSYMSMGQPLAALDVLRNSIKSGFATIQVFEAYAEAMMQAEGSKAALRAIKNMPEGVAEAPQLQLLKSHILVNEKRYDEAMAIIAGLPPEFANSARAMEITGRAQAGNEDFSAAIPALQEAFDKLKTPKSAQLLYKALKNNGQDDEALAVLKKAADISQGYDEADLFYVSELAKTDKQAAISFYEQLVSAQPKNWQAMNNIAWLLYEEKRYSDAYQWIMKALNLRPSNKSLLDTKKRIEEAIKSK